MSSGIKVNAGVVTSYQKVKKEKKIPYVIFKIQDEKEVVVETEGSEGDTFEIFREKMLEAANISNEGRYAVYDVKDEKTGHSRLLFVIWVNDDKCKIKSKMLYASSKSNCIKSLEGQTKEIQVNDETDFSFENFVEAAFKK